MTDDIIESLQKNMRRYRARQELANEEFRESLLGQVDLFFYKLRDWQDSDHAEYLLGETLGIFDHYNNDIKWIFWTNNVIGETLFDILQGLVKLGLLEYDKERRKYKACDKFKEILKKEEESE